MINGEENNTKGINLLIFLSLLSADTLLYGRLEKYLEQ